MADINVQFAITQRSFIDFADIQWRNVGVCAKFFDAEGNELRTNCAGVSGRNVVRDQNGNVVRGEITWNVPGVDNGQPASARLWFTVNGTRITEFIDIQNPPNGFTVRLVYEGAQEQQSSQG